ncbi:MAG: NUDIX hydrolase [Candidatus Liptonbacteria bacterium]|nr:NUDIX hydrolase [Candidatus Liptonbacteria bacterium]
MGEQDASQNALNEGRSRTARDKTASTISLVIRDEFKEIKKGDEVTRVKTGEVLKILVVWNKSYADRGRVDNFSPGGKGKPRGVGLPTGGSESQEYIDHVAVRETLNESGHEPDRIIKHFTEFRVDKRKKGKEGVHPHYIYWVATDPDWVVEIKEKDEILKSDWLTLRDILQRVELGLTAKAEGRVDYEAFYFSHASFLLLPVFLHIAQMSPEEISVISDEYYRAAVLKYQPHIRKALDDNWDICKRLGLWERCEKLGLFYENDPQEV